MLESLELTARELSELRLALIYARDFHHGTVGHNSYMLLAKLAESLGFLALDDGTLAMPPFVVVVEK